MWPVKIAAIKIERESRGREEVRGHWYKCDYFPVSLQRGREKYATEEMISTVEGSIQQQPLENTHRDNTTYHHR